jgi:flagellar biosynthesis/type III secretory pathway M-ring protein FliF/YscJ
MPEVDDDTSASTARFRAFAERTDEELPAPWKMRAPKTKIALLAAIVVVVAVVVAILANVVAG